MNIILLSGGSGRRLWPLSNDIRSKQFIKVYKTAEGDYESMLQRMYRHITAVDPDAKITIATNFNQVPLIHNQLSDKVSISMEPERRDTFPAIALASAFLHDRQGVGEDEPVVVCPVDPYVEDAYFTALRELSALAQAGAANLSLMGIQPTFPSDKYGYIIPSTDAHVSGVRSFHEKPDVETAKGYLARHALWNGGIFAFKLSYLLRRTEEIIGFSDYQTLYANYGMLAKTSFDYAVVEHEPSIQVMRYHDRWEDIGSWQTFAAAMPDPVVGSATLDGSCLGTTVINETSLPVLCMGCKNMVIAVSGDGILVSDIGASDSIKPYVGAIESPMVREPRLWGSVSLLDQTADGAVVKFVLNAGQTAAVRQNGVFMVLSGRGSFTHNGASKAIAPGASVPSASGGVFTAETELQLIQVQQGNPFFASLV